MTEIINSKAINHFLQDYWESHPIYAIRDKIKCKTKPISIPMLLPQNTQYDIRNTIYETKTNPIPVSPSAQRTKKTRKRCRFLLPFFPKNTKYYEILQNFPKIYSQKVSKPTTFTQKHNKSTHFCSKNAKKHVLFKYTYPHNAAFPIIYPPKAAFCRFLQLLDINTLNSIYNKDLQSFFAPKYPPSFTKCEPRKYEKRTQSRKTSRIEHRKHAKRTQFTQYAIRKEFTRRSFGGTYAIREKNEPKLKLTAHMHTSPNGPRGTSHDSSKTNPI